VHAGRDDGAAQLIVLKSPISAANAIEALGHGRIRSPMMTSRPNQIYDSSLRALKRIALHQILNL
jgi:hypothetical protein